MEHAGALRRSAAGHMTPLHAGSRRSSLLLAGSLLLLGLQAVPGWAAEYGRLTGSVADPQGNPLMGATVLLTGPVSLSLSQEGASLERVITDVHGSFMIDHLLPGWYSLKVTSPTRLPVLRNGIQIKAGETATERFVLTDIFAPVRFQLPKNPVSSWGEDWKWVLRTSSATRPILRYRQEVAQAAPKPQLTPPGQRLFGLAPGAAGRDPLSGDPGLGSVVAYLRPFSDDADFFVAGSMAPYGVQTSSVATAFRNHLLRGDPQELTLVVHQLGFSDGVPIPSGNSQDPLGHAQGAMISYMRVRRLSPAITLTMGVEIDYLNAAEDALTLQPRLKLDYRLNPDTRIAFQYGTGRGDGADTLLERVGVLSAFPRVTLRDYHPQLEQLNHGEISVRRRLGRNSRLELAAYHDSLHNAAAWGSGTLGSSGWLAGNLLSNPVALNGVILNVGNYQASGLRAAYAQSFGNHLEALFAYASGDALAAQGPLVPRPQAALQDYLQSKRSNSLAGKVSARLPVTHTQVTTSYGWSQRGRVTAVDPNGQANSQLQPYLGVQIRQPLPNIAFLPAHIEALVDFRNLLAQGYVPLAPTGEKPILLSSAYRSLRGGFSVQF